MNSPEISTILSRLDKQDRDHADLRRDVREIGQDVKETKAQAKLTNGRVSQLENDKLVDEALRKQRAELLAEQSEHHDKKLEAWRAYALTLLGAVAGYFAVNVLPHLLGKVF